MTMPREIETPRLLLRQWRVTDFPAFAAMSHEVQVMACLPERLTHAESDVLAERCAASIRERGWRFWAPEEKAARRFIGFAGLGIPSPALLLSPCVEIAWRLARSAWGRGLAAKAARAALHFAFTALALPEIVAFTARINHRSLALMERLGMREDGDFPHPALPAGHPLRLHRLFQLTAGGWRASFSTSFQSKASA